MKGLHPRNLYAFLNIPTTAKEEDFKVDPNADVRTLAAYAVLSDEHTREEYTTFGGGFFVSSSLPGDKDEGPLSSTGQAAGASPDRFQFGCLREFRDMCFEVAVVRNDEVTSRLRQEAEGAKESWKEIIAVMSPWWCVEDLVAAITAEDEDARSEAYQTLQTLLCTDPACFAHVVTVEVIAAFTALLEDRFSPKRDVSAALYSLLSKCIAHGDLPPQKECNIIEGTCSQLLREPSLQKHPTVLLPVLLLLARLTQDEAYAKAALNCGLLHTTLGLIVQEVSLYRLSILVTIFHNLSLLVFTDTKSAVDYQGYIRMHLKVLASLAGDLERQGNTKFHGIGLSDEDLPTLRTVQRRLMTVIRLIFKNTVTLPVDRRPTLNKLAFFSLVSLINHPCEDIAEQAKASATATTQLLNPYFTLSRLLSAAEWATVMKEVLTACLRKDAPRRPFFLFARLVSSNQGGGIPTSHPDDPQLVEAAVEMFRLSVRKKDTSTNITQPTEDDDLGEGMTSWRHHRVVALQCLQEVFRKENVERVKQHISVVRLLLLDGIKGIEEAESEALTLPFVTLIGDVMEQCDDPDAAGLVSALFQASRRKKAQYLYENILKLITKAILNAEPGGNADFVESLFPHLLLVESSRGQAQEQALHALLALMKRGHSAVVLKYLVSPDGKQIEFTPESVPNGDDGWRSGRYLEAVSPIVHTLVGRLAGALQKASEGTLEEDDVAVDPDPGKGAAIEAVKKDVRLPVPVPKPQRVVLPMPNAKCETCGMVCKDINALAAHKSKAKHGYWWSCTYAPQCHWEFAHPSALHDHLHTEHRERPHNPAGGGGYRPGAPLNEINALRAEVNTLRQQQMQLQQQIRSQHAGGAAQGPPAYGGAQGWKPPQASWGARGRQPARLPVVSTKGMK